MQFIFNEFLDCLKFKNSRVCIAKNRHQQTGQYTVPCTKYTRRDYCQRHAQKKHNTWKNYHMIEHWELYAPLTKAEVAEKELLLRLEYTQQFSLKCDYGHSMWNNKLRAIIYNTIAAERKATEACENKIRARYNYVKEHHICPVALKANHHYLEVGRHFERHLKARKEQEIEY